MSRSMACECGEEAKITGLSQEKPSCHVFISQAQRSHFCCIACKINVYPLDVSRAADIENTELASSF